MVEVRRFQVPEISSHLRAEERRGPRLALAAEPPAPPPAPLPAKEKHPPSAADALLATIEQEIIPRLMMAHREDPARWPGSPPSEALPSRLRPTSAEVESLAGIAASYDLPAAMASVESVCRQGLSLEAALLELVAGAGRLLGEQWMADLRSFAEVTSGLATLHQVVNLMSFRSLSSAPLRGLIILVAAAGEQHTLGLNLVGEFFRRAGWGVHVDPRMSEAQLVELVSTEQVDMVGISVSSAKLAEPLAHLTGAVRSASRNPDMAVMIGGNLDLEGQVSKIGATHYAAGPREAVELMDDHAKNVARIKR